ncbi:MAG: YbgA family protein [Porticoccaceae bacterium]
MTEQHPEKIPVGISSCLLGEAVRHDGGHKRNDEILETLGRWFDLQPCCPEVAIGMGVPRPPVRLVRTAEGVRARGVRDPTLDVTDALEACARDRRDWHARLCGYIFKKDSPSCGVTGVRIYPEDSEAPEPDGTGLYAARLMASFPLLPVEDECHLADPALRENFVRRAHVLWRWQQMMAEGVSTRTLTDFHARHKLILMSHDQNAYRALGRIAAGTDALESRAEAYIEGAMAALKKLATRANHVNVLQHIQGYLKRELARDARAELAAVIACYRNGEVPLSVPIGLLRQHFRTAPDPFIARSWYLDPYPDALALMNF